MAHVLTAPPALVGVSPTTSVFLVNVNGEFAYEMSGCFVLNGDRNGRRIAVRRIVRPNCEYCRGSHRGWCSVDGSVGCAKQETAR